MSYLSRRKNSVMLVNVHINSILCQYCWFCIQLFEKFTPRNILKLNFHHDVEHSRSLITFYEHNFVLIGVKTRCCGGKKCQMTKRCSKSPFLIPHQPQFPLSPSLSRDGIYTTDNVNDHKCQRKIIIIICWCNFNYGLCWCCS